MHLLRTGLAALTIAAWTATASAQTTHEVQVGPGFTFSPKDISIDVGDTVRWTWQGGFHNVESGKDGFHDGFFSSGTPTSDIGVQFSVTFDLAFLSAYPISGNLYDYFCTVHSFAGHVGSIQVLSPFEIYGCLSPTGSLTVLGGSPSLGGQVTLGVDDPVGSSSPGAGTLLLLALAPDPAFPCGTPLPGYGMEGPTGDLLVSLVPPNPLAFLGPQPWLGAGQPTAMDVSIPAAPILVGVHVFVQGVVAGGVPNGGVKLTRGVRFEIQP